MKKLFALLLVVSLFAAMGTAFALGPGSRMDEATVVIGLDGQPCEVEGLHTHEGATILPILPMSDEQARAALDGLLTPGVARPNAEFCCVPGAGKTQTAWVYQCQLSGNICTAYKTAVYTCNNCGAISYGTTFNAGTHVKGSVPICAYYIAGNLGA